MKILLLIFISNFIKSHYACQLPNTNIQITSAHQNYSSPIRSKRNIQNFRIYVHYDISFNTMKNGEEYKKKVIKPAVKFWEDTLQLKTSMNSPILIDRECNGNHRFVFENNRRLKICQYQCLRQQICSNTIIPDQFLANCYIDDTFDGYSSHGTSGKGAENADVIIIIAHQSQLCRPFTVASSTTCHLEHITDRPLLGVLNICPSRINFQNNLNVAISTIKHEIVHILGFNLALFPFYRDKYDIPLTPRDYHGYPNIGSLNISFNQYYKSSDQTIIEKNVQLIYRTGIEQKTLHFLITPNVKREARNHFNCPSLEGMLLEDYGNEHSSISHFERRILQNELMTASAGKQVYVSRFTMAQLEDTGWYYPNYNMADDFSFGKDAGCDFIFQTCYEYIKTRMDKNQSIYPYCNVESNSVKCSDDLSYISHCDLRKNYRSSIAKKYRYFEDTDLVSSDPFSEYCPYYKEYTRKFRNIEVSNGVCTNKINNDMKNTKYDITSENYGPSSICLKFNEYKLVQSCTPSRGGYNIHAGCYKYRCSMFRRLVIMVGNMEYICSHDGEIIDVEMRTNSILAKGKIVCPQCNLLCHTIVCSSYLTMLPVQCSGVNGQCRNETTWDLKCLGFQNDFDFSIIGFLLSIILYLHFF